MGEAVLSDVALKEMGSIKHTVAVLLRYFVFGPGVITIQTPDPRTHSSFISINCIRSLLLTRLVCGT